MMRAPKRKVNGYHWNPPDKEWLYDQYITKEKSAFQLTKELGAAVGTVILWLEQVGIHSRTRSQAQVIKGSHWVGKDAPNWRGGHRFYGRSVLRRAGTPMQCAWCGCLQDLQAHHRDHNKWNHSLENLEWLCRECHNFETALWKLLKQNKVRLVAEGNQMIIKFGIEAGPATW